MKHNELIEELSNLKLEEKCLKRNIDRNYPNLKIRTRLFERLKEVQVEIKQTKFKIRFEKEIRKNENNN